MDSQGCYPAIYVTIPGMRYDWEAYCTAFVRRLDYEIVELLRHFGHSRPPRPLAAGTGRLAVLPSRPVSSSS